MDLRTYETVDSPEALDAAIARVREAQRQYASFTQEQVDRIFLAAATAASQARIPLAKLAVEETGMGVVEDKVIKNHYASEYIYNAYRDTKTCGVIEEDKAGGMMKIAEPIGVVAAVICASGRSTGFGTGIPSSRNDAPTSAPRIIGFFSTSRKRCG